MTRKFRFGVRNTGSSRREWQTFACKAEDLGYSTLVVQDHFGEQLAPLPALVSAAEVTSSIRLAAIVLDNDFRHPAALAKEAATVDVLSDGRLELGIGAGWLMDDYRMTGLTFGPPKERLERLAEAAQIYKAFFTGDPVTFNGNHYHIEGLDSFPKSVQRPNPPLMIGGRQRRMLALAARDADIVSISMVNPAGPGQPKPVPFVEKVEWVRAAAGARYDDIEIHVNAQIVEVTDNQEAVLETIASRLKIAPEDVLHSPVRLVGSVNAIVEQLHAWRERCDVSYFVVDVKLMDAMAPIVARIANT